jgi:hypothetical protein
MMTPPAVLSLLDLLLGIVAILVAAAIGFVYGVQKGAARRTCLPCQRRRGGQTLTVLRGGGTHVRVLTPQLSTTPDESRRLFVLDEVL